MTNLYSGSIKSNGEYIDLQEATGVSFVVGNYYQLQFFNQAYIREGEEGDGFFITFLYPFTIEYKGGKVYVKSAKNLGINIAE